MSSATALNEATLTFQRSNWNPRPENISDVGLNYINVMRIGGRDTTQDFVQTRVSLRDDYTRFAQWRGSHALKAGVVVSFLDYDVTKFLTGNPLFELRHDENFAFPFQARYGVGNPDLSTDNRQFGFYVQDDWTVGPRLTINAGVRWDYESDMLNNDYVTPEAVRAATAPFVDGNRYFTDGATGRRSTPPGSRASGSRTTSPATASTCSSAATAATTIASSTTPASTSASACSMRCARSSSRSTARRATASRPSSGIPRTRARPGSTA